MDEFGNIFKNLREEKGWTQDQMAKMLDTSRSTVGDYETGRKMPRYDRLKQIADIFHTSIDYLLGYTEQRDPVEDLEKRIRSDQPDLVEILKHKQPQLYGEPLNEAQKAFLLDVFESFYNRMITTKD